MLAGWLDGVGVETAGTGVPAGVGVGVPGAGVVTAVAVGFGVGVGVGVGVGAGTGAPDGWRAWSELALTIRDDSSTASKAEAGTPFSCEIIVSYWGAAQPGSSVPWKNQLDPLSATIMP